MKYRMLLLLALLVAIVVSAVGGTLAGYTSEDTFSFSVQPDMGSINQQSQQLIETPNASATKQDTQASEEAARVAESTTEEMQSAISGEASTNSKETTDSLNENK